MKIYIVTEGKTDVAWLRWLLAPEVTEFQAGCYSGGGQSGAVSTARTLTAVHMATVVLVVDSDTTDLNKVAELEQGLRAVLGQVAPERVWRVCLAVPAIEAWILADARVVKDLLGVTLSSREKNRLLHKPKEAMAKLFQQANRAYTPEAIEAVTSERDAAHLRETEPVRTIRHDIEELAAVASSLPVR